MRVTQGRGYSSLLMRRAAILLCLVACTGGKGRVLSDPTNQNPSQPHAPGEPTYVTPGNDPAAAAIMTAVGVGASVQQRKAGGCYANCPPGTSCNPATGYCDELPCRGLCPEGQWCDTSGPLPRCVSTKATDLKIDSAAPPR